LDQQQHLGTDGAATSCARQEDLFPEATLPTDDERFVKDARWPMKYGKLLCILPEKDANLQCARLNDRLRQRWEDAGRPRRGFPSSRPVLRDDEAKLVKRFNLVPDQAQTLQYLQYRMLSVAEQERCFHLPRLPGPEQRRWTHYARSMKVANAALGEGFDVQMMAWRLGAPCPDGQQPGAAQLQVQCRHEQRPLRVLSVCDGIAGALATLLRVGGWDYGITYVAIEKNEDCRRMVRRIVDHYEEEDDEEEIKLVQIPKSGNLLDLLQQYQEFDKQGKPTELKDGSEKLTDGHAVRSYLEHAAGGTIDLVVSGYPCKGHSSLNRAQGRRGKRGHDSVQSGRVWDALFYVLYSLTKGAETQHAAQPARGGASTTNLVGHDAFT
jgi:hypothetical protein